MLYVCLTDNLGDRSQSSILEAVSAEQLSDQTEVSISSSFGYEGTSDA